MPLPAFTRHGEAEPLERKYTSSALWISWAGSRSEQCLMAGHQLRQARESALNSGCKNSRKGWETSLRSKQQIVRPQRQNKLVEDQRGLTEHLSCSWRRLRGNCNQAWKQGLLSRGTLVRVRAVWKPFPNKKVIFLFLFFYHWRMKFDFFKLGSLRFLWGTYYSN